MEEDAFFVDSDDQEMPHDDEFAAFEVPDMPMRLVRANVRVEDGIDDRTFDPPIKHGRLLGSLIGSNDESEAKAPDPPKGRLLGRMLADPAKNAMETEPRKRAHNTESLIPRPPPKRTKKLALLDELLDNLDNGEETSPDVGSPSDDVAEEDFQLDVGDVETGPSDNVHRVNYAPDADEASDEGAFEEDGADEEVATNDAVGSETDRMYDADDDALEDDDDFDDDFIDGSSAHSQRSPRDTAAYDSDIDDDDFIDSSRSSTMMITRPVNVIAHTPRDDARGEVKSVLPRSAMSDKLRPRLPVLDSRYPSNMPFSLHDPRTRLALENIGLEQADLCYPSETDLNAYSRDPALREAVRRKLCGNVDRLVAEVERELHDMTSRQREKRVKRTGLPALTVNPEQEAARTRKRQRRAVEAMLLQMLRKKHLVENEQEHEKAEQARKDAAAVEQKKKRKLDREKRRELQELAERKEREREAAIVEQKRIEAGKLELQEERLKLAREQKRFDALQKEEERRHKVEAVKKQHEGLEKERERRSNEKLREIEVKEQQRLMRLEDERNQLKQGRSLERERKEKIQREMKRKEANKRRQMIKESSERQKRIDDAVRALEEQKQARVIFHRTQEKRKQERAKKIRADAETRRLELEEASRTKQELAEMLLHAQTIDKERRALEGKLEYEEMSMNMKLKRDQQAEQEAEQFRQAEAESLRREEKFAEAQKEAAEQRNRRALEDKVKHRQRKFEAIRKMRRDAALQNRKLRERELEDNEAADAHALESAAVAQAKRRRRLAESDEKRADLDLAETLKSADTDSAVLLGLAAKYGIDMSLLEERAARSGGGYIDAQMEIADDE